jgi:hypothetical protein
LVATRTLAGETAARNASITAASTGRDVMLWQILSSPS